MKTVTPPFAGASSTITFTYDIDGNLTRIDFPPDSFAQAYFLRLGYDTKNRLTFLADAAGNAIVYERTAGRVTREALYSGFVESREPWHAVGRFDVQLRRGWPPAESLQPARRRKHGLYAIRPDPNSNPTSITDENGKQDNAASTTRSIG